LDDYTGSFLSYHNNESDIALKLCHRNFGIGADGVIFVRNSDIAHIQMTIYNADGSYASMCGNGIRCFAKYVWDKGIVKENPLKIETGDGIKIAELTIHNNEVTKVTINMGKESFDTNSIPAKYNEEIINKKIISKHPFKTELEVAATIELKQEWKKNKILKRKYNRQNL